MNTENSWILKTVLLSPEGTKEKYAMNIFNGLTPAGTNWFVNYTDGYLYFTGTLQTYGSFSSILIGCSYYKYLGNVTFFRTGGAFMHTGEYIHSVCNDYSTNNNSITSRVGWTNSRVFWAAFKFYFDCMFYDLITLSV